MDSPRYSAFTITSTPYKIVNGQEIPVNIFLPRDITAGKLPILVHFHGGFLFTGDSLFPDWTAQWSLDHVLSNSAIRVSANYRLLPESTGLDVLSDIKDLYTWIETSSPSYLRSIGSRVEPDFEKIMVYGESAGGYLALQSAILRPDLVKAVIAAYPMTYIDDAWYSVASTTKSPFGSPQLPRSILDSHIASMEAGKIVSGAFPPARLALALSALQSGSLTGLIGTDDTLYPARIISKMSGAEKMPFLFIFSGKQDSAVPWEHTERFAKLWESKFGKENVYARFETGDHGFDGEVSVETPWMREGLESVTRRWIS